MLKYEIVVLSAGIIVKRMDIHKASLCEFLFYKDMNKKEGVRLSYTFISYKKDMLHKHKRVKSHLTYMASHMKLHLNMSNAYDFNPR